MTSNNKKLFLFFGAMFLFAAVLTVGAGFVLKKIPIDSRPAGAVERDPVLPNIGGAEGKPASSISDIRDPAEMDNRPIIYAESGFSPGEITIKASDALGCVITARNKSNKIIKVGANPHAASGDPGANYGELAPGEVGIYDVRYPGLTEITLHNHFNPAEKFKIIYGEGCK